MEITHVVRGEEHVAGTPKYLLVRDALGLGRPDVFAHLPLLVNAQRKKLSKRRDPVSVGEFRARGVLADAMRNYLCLLGWGPPDDVEIRPIDEIVELFRLHDVQPSPAFFDEKKLEHFNATYIRALTTDEFLDRVGPFLEEPARSMEPLAALAPHIQERTRVLAEAEPMVDFLYRPEVSFEAESWDKAMTAKADEATAMLDAAIAAWGDVRLERRRPCTSRCGPSARRTD